MTLALLIAGAAIAVSFLCVMTVRAGSPVLAGETTMVGLSDPAAETLSHHNQPRAEVASDWRMTTVSSLSDAEDLLDCLENQGIAERELVILGDSSFAVRWR